MDSFSQHPDRVGSNTGGRIYNLETNKYYNYCDSSFNVVNMWISSLPGIFKPKPGGLTGTRQQCMTTCNGRKATKGLQLAAELELELMLYSCYTFAIERNTSGYSLEVSGNFACTGFKVSHSQKKPILTVIDFDLFETEENLIKIIFCNYILNFRLFVCIVSLTST